MVHSRHCSPMMTETGRILPPVVPLPPNNVKLSPIFLSHSRSELQPAGFPGGPRHQQRVIRLETESAGSGVVWCQSSPVRPCCSSAVELRWLGRREEGVRHWSRPGARPAPGENLKHFFSDLKSQPQLVVLKIVAWRRCFYQGRGGGLTKERRGGLPVISVKRSCY